MKPNGELEFEYEYWQQILILNGQIAKNSQKIVAELTELLEQHKHPLVVAHVGEAFEQFRNIIDACEATAEVVRGRVAYHKNNNPDQ